MSRHLDTLSCPQALEVLEMIGTDPDLSPALVQAAVDRIDVTLNDADVPADVVRNIALDLLRTLSPDA